MITPDPRTITGILHDVRAGNSDAVGRLLPLVYEELQVLARAAFSSERSGHTLQPTALAHEAWLKLVGDLGTVEDRRHFFALAARAMRRVLTDHARSTRRQKRAGARIRVALDAHLLLSEGQELDLVELDDTLDRLASLNERHARVVELRFFGGLTIPETAEALGIASATVERDWFLIRGWLRRELRST